MRVFLVAYDVNPYKGSEAGMGWNFANGISKFANVTLVTRSNNKVHIDEYMTNLDEGANITFLYYDLPKIFMYLKSGAKFWAFYYYFWQLFLSIHFRKLIRDADVVHALNFHTDSFPSFLWLFNKNFVWGPVNHHEKIPDHLLYPSSILNKLKFKLIWNVKILNWSFNPFLWLTTKFSKVLLVGSSAVESRLCVDKNTQLMKMSSVGISPGYVDKAKWNKRRQRSLCRLLSIGRFVELKGFDLSIDAVKLAATLDKDTTYVLSIIGTGPLESVIKARADHDLPNLQIKLTNWMPRDKLISHYAEADAFLFPSHEGAGMVVAEALVNGLPIICLKNNGPYEIALQAALSVDPLDISRAEVVAKLADHIISVARQDSRYKRARENTISVAQNYFWENKCMKIYESYQLVSRRFLK